MATASFLHFTPCGLIFDVSGIVLLGFAFFFKNTKAMIEESGTTWDSKAYIIVAASKSDGIFGTLLLLLGFVFQTIGFVGIESRNAVLASYSGLLLFLIAYVGFVRRRLINKWVGDIEARFREKQA